MRIDWKKEIKLSGLWKRSDSKRSRPSLGGPELHAPKFVSDLYSDLRDRHLLPLVVLLIVAMIAAPILLSGKGQTEEAATITPAKAAGAEAADAGFTVVPAEPGLRDSKRRLGHRTALNPFRRPPESKASPTAGAQGSGATSTTRTSGSTEPTAGETTSYSASTPVTTQATKTIKVGNVTKEVPLTAAEGEANEAPAAEPTKVESTHAATPPVETTKTETTTVESAGGETGTVEKHESTTTTEGASTATPEAGGVTHEIVGYTIDAEAGFVPHSTEKTELAPMTKLPNAKHPVVLFIGLSKDHRRALFLMTSQVTAYYGGHCALDKQACQLVEVQPGKGVTFAYGYGESRFKVHLRKIVPTLRFSK
jgi:hypothetical protein